MPQVSQRGNVMPASPIRRLVPLAVKAMDRGIKVYRLNIGQPDLPTPQAGLDALKNIDRKVLEYSPSEGLLSLRKKLQQYYKRFNIDVDVDDIIVTTGGSEPCPSHSWPASIPAMKSSFQNRLMPTIWHSLYRPEQKSSLSPPLSTKASSCRR